VNGSDQKYFWEKLVPVFKCRDIYAIVDIAYDGEITLCFLIIRCLYFGIEGEKFNRLWLKPVLSLENLTRMEICLRFVIVVVTTFREI
jgi:hypothetical protein